MLQEQLCLSHDVLGKVDGLLRDRQIPAAVTVAPPARAHLCCTDWLLSRRDALW